MLKKKNVYVVAYLGPTGRVRTRRLLAASYGEATMRLCRDGIADFQLSHIPGSATYAEQREKVKQWLTLS